VRQVKRNSLINKDSDKEKKWSGNQTKHADSQLHNQPKVKLLERKDINLQNGTYLQLNKVLKTENHGDC
jgi:hypothetical protein